MRRNKSKRATSRRPTLKTRKPIDELTANDLVAFPIWEFASDEEDDEDQDETWVRPVDAQVVRKGQWSLSVAAEFRTQAGITIPGLIGVSTAEGLDIGDAVLLPDTKYIFVDASTAKARRETARALGMSARELFPLEFTLRVRIGREKELRKGLIE